MINDSKELAQQLEDILRKPVATSCAVLAGGIAGKAEDGIGREGTVATACAVLAGGVVDGVEDEFGGGRTGSTLP